MTERLLFWMLALMPLAAVIVIFAMAMADRKQSQYRARIGREIEHEVAQIEKRERLRQPHVAAFDSSKRAGRVSKAGSERRNAGDPASDTAMSAALYQHSFVNHGLDHSPAPSVPDCTPDTSSSQSFGPSGCSDSGPVGGGGGDF